MNKDDYIRPLKSTVLCTEIATVTQWRIEEVTSSKVKVTRSRRYSWRSGRGIILDPCFGSRSFSSFKMC